MLKRSSRFIAIALLLSVSSLGVQPAIASGVPSKTAPDQSLEARAADLDTVREFVAHEQVAGVLAEHGFTQDQVNDRIARLSDEDLRSLANNMDQIQAAGITQREWLYVAIGALLVLLVIVLVD